MIARFRSAGPVVFLACVALALPLEAASGEKTPELLRRAIGQARNLIEGGQPSEAAEELRPLLDHLEELEGEDWQLASGVIGTLALALHLSGDDFQQADRPRLLRLLEMQEAALGEGRTELSALLEELGCVDESARNFEEAEVLYRRVLELDQGEEPTPADRLRLYQSLARAQMWMGDSGGALGFLMQGLEILEKIYGNPAQLLHGPRQAEGLEPTALHLLDLGMAHANLGDYDEAQRYFEQALALFSRMPQDNVASIAATELRLGWLAWIRHDLPRARRLIEDSWQRRLATTPSGDAAFGFTAVALGRVLLDLGEDRAAKEKLDLATEILEKNFDKSSIQASLAHSALTLRAWQRGDLTTARSWLLRTLGDYPTEAPHPSKARLLASLARLDFAEGRRGPAFENALRAEEIGRETLRWNFEGVAEGRGLFLAGSRPSGLDLLLTLAAFEPAKVGKAWNEVIRSRAMVFDEMAARQQLSSRLGDAEEQQRFTDLATARQRLADLYGRNNVDPLAIELALRRRDEAQKALGRSRVYHLTDARQQIGLTAVRAALPPGDALLAYVRFQRFDQRQAALPPGTRNGEADYLALLWPAGAAEPKLVPLGPAAAIEAALGRLEEQNDRHSEARYRRLGSQVRRLVWDPLAHHLAGSRRIFVVPAGELYRLSLATLPDDSGGYLVEGDWLFHYLSAERDLVPSSEPAKLGTGALAVGGVAFDLDPQTPEAKTAASRGKANKICPPTGPLSFASLPASAAEARQMLDLWRIAKAPGSPQGLLGKGATESAFKLLAPGQRYLHLATHAFTRSEGCALSPGSSKSLANESPLLLSGLAMAGANQRQLLSPGEDDGLLTAEEVAALDLSGVEWAVLSACSTGLGDIKAWEGVLGLRRAFRMAGVQTLITSLWPVDDEATRAFMKELYKARFEEKLDTATALREASRRLLLAARARGESTHPNSWGGFIAEGDWH